MQAYCILYESAKESIHEPVKLIEIPIATRKRRYGKNFVPLANKTLTVHITTPWGICINKASDSEQPIPVIEYSQN